MSIAETPEQRILDSAAVDLIPPMEIDIERDKVRPLMVAETVQMHPGAETEVPIIDEDDNRINYESAVVANCFTQMDDTLSSAITVFSLGEPTHQTYVVKDITDIFQIPPHRLADFMASLYLAYALQRAVKVSLTNLSGYFNSFGEEGFVWIDDGLISTKMNLRMVDPESGRSIKIEDAGLHRTNTEPEATTEVIQKSTEGTNVSDDFIRLYVHPFTADEMRPKADG